MQLQWKLLASISSSFKGSAWLRGSLVPSSGAHNWICKRMYNYLPTVNTKYFTYYTKQVLSQLKPINCCAAYSQWSWNLLASNVDFWNNQICDNNQSYGFSKTPKIQQREVLWGRTTSPGRHPHRDVSFACVEMRMHKYSRSVFSFLPLLLNWARAQSDWPLQGHCCPLLKHLRFCRSCIFLCLGPLNQELSPEISNPTKSVTDQNEN